MDDYDELWGAAEEEALYDEPPLFGCACQNPSSVDEVCRSCAYQMAMDMGGRAKVAAIFYEQHCSRSRRVKRGGA